MPIITVELVTDAEHPLAHDLAQSIADAVGRVLASPPGRTWVRLRSLQRNEYAENESSVDAAAMPVFVTILENRQPSGAELHAGVAALTRAIANVVGRPDSCVHIEYAAAAAGRVSFGGKIVQ